MLGDILITNSHTLWTQYYQQSRTGLSVTAPLSFAAINLYFPFIVPFFRFGIKFPFWDVRGGIFANFSYSSCVLSPPSSPPPHEYSAVKGLTSLGACDARFRHEFGRWMGGVGRFKGVEGNNEGQPQAGYGPHALS